MIKRSGIFPVIFILCSLALSGQTRDFQTWYEAKFRKDFSKDFGLSAEIGQRFRNNSTQYDRTLLTLDGDYDLGISSPVKVTLGGGARFLMAADRESNVSPRYRVHADASGKMKLSEVDLSLRVRFQYGFEEFTYFAAVNENNIVNRYRLKAEYHIFGTRFGTEAYLEPWGLITANGGRFFRKMRYSAGVTYTLNFVSGLSLRYILEDELNRANPMLSSILVFGYSRDL